MQTTDYFTDARITPYLHRAYDAWMDAAESKRKKDGSVEFTRYQKAQEFQERRLADARTALTEIVGETLAADLTTPASLLRFQAHLSRKAAAHFEAMAAEYESGRRAA